MRMRIVLASRSPRRIELIQQLGITAEVVPADIDESPLNNESPVEYVRRLAQQKALAVKERTATNLPVLAADTTVDVDGIILAQPTDIEDSRRMLKMLSGRAHRVHTGVVVANGAEVDSVVVTSIVTFHPITDEAMDWYLSTGESVGKAGAYAVQGEAGVLVESVKGSMSNVIGLPLRETASLLGLAPPPDNDHQG